MGKANYDRNKITNSNDSYENEDSEENEEIDENEEFEENEDNENLCTSNKATISINEKTNSEKQIKNSDIKENDQTIKISTSSLNKNDSEKSNISKNNDNFINQIENKIKSNEKSTNKHNSSHSLKMKTIDTTNLLLNINPINKKAKIVGSNYSLEIALEKMENLLHIKVNHDLYAWKNLSKSFSNDELDKCNSIWKNHSLEEKYTLMIAFFFGTKRENNIEELVDIASKYINIDQRLISVSFKTGIKKNEITMKLEENKFSFKDLLIAEKLYFILESKCTKTNGNISNITKFIREYDERIERLRNCSLSHTVINLNI